MTLQGQQCVTGGDVITAIDGQSSLAWTSSGRDQPHKPGDTVTLSVISGSSTKDVKVTLAVRPQNF